MVELVAEVSAELVPLAITAGTAMSFHTELESYQVMGDRGSLSRALTNVMQNALVHGGKNGQITLP